MVQEDFIPILIIQKNRVVVNADADPFAREGKSIFAKFVIDCDINIRSNEEVLIVNEKDESDCLW